MDAGRADRAVAPGAAPHTNSGFQRGGIMFHNILVAVDGSSHADLALTDAINLAESEHARLTLITGIPEVPWSVYLSPASGIPTLAADARAESEAILRRARDRVPDDLPVTTLLTDKPI